MRLPSPPFCEMLIVPEKDWGVMPTNKLKPLAQHFETAIKGLKQAYESQMADDLPPLTAEEIRELPLETKILLARNCVMVSHETCRKIEALAAEFVGG